MGSCGLTGCARHRGSRAPHGPRPFQLVITLPLDFGWQACNPYKKEKKPYKEESIHRPAAEDAYQCPGWLARS